MQYGIDNEPVAHEAYIAKQREYNRMVFVRKTGHNIDWTPHRLLGKELLLLTMLCVYCTDFTIGQLVGSFTRWLGFRLQ